MGVLRIDDIVQHEPRRGRPGRRPAQADRFRVPALGDAGSEVVVGQDHVDETSCGVRHQRLDETAPSRREAPRDRSRRPQDPGLVVEGNPAWAHWVNRETGEHALQPLKGDEPNSEANEDVE